ncbi:MAG TPA: tetratricopeptide repeat protein [candidate division Zixibacteria bacterium]|nr:tetratricopeptide repeat protein [candidate division Zixibacteria bacterium]
MEPLNVNQVLALIAATLILLLIILFFWSKARTSKKKASPQKYIAALKALVAGDDNLAFAKLREAVLEDTDNIDAYLKLGDLLRKRNRGDKALEIHRQLSLRPNLDGAIKHEIQTSLALDYISLGHTDKGISLLEELLKEDKGDLGLSERLLEEYEKNNEWEKAFETKKQILKHKQEKDDRILAYYRVLEGNQKAEKGEYHQARLAFKEALHYDETCVPAYIFLGDAYYLDRRLDEAVDYWKKLIEVKPEAGYLVFERLEKTLFEKGKFQDMAEIYHNILRENPKDVKTLYALASIYEKKGNVKAAIEAMTDVLEIDGDFYPAMKDLINLYRHNGQTDKALRISQQMTESIPGKFESYTCGNCNYVSTEPLWLCPQCRKINSFDI